LSENVASKPIRLALAVADSQLADRLGALLAGVPGLQLVAPGETADATVVLPTGAEPMVDGQVLLTPRELEVLALLAEGASNKTIARRLGISVHTAKFHVGSLLDKLDAVGRTDALAHAARLGVINL
jgi:DNA-binding CsgD family transcriptional regulator